MDGRSVGFGEDVAAFVAAAGGQAVFELAAPMQPQLCDGVGVEVDGAAAGGGLEVAFDELVLHRQQLLADGQACGVEVDVAPYQPGDLGSAHAGGRGQQVQRAQVVVGDGVQESAQLVAGPHAHGSAVAAGGGRIGEVGDVAHYGAFAFGVGESALDGDVDVADGLGRQAAACAVALALGEQPGIERVEVLGPQLLYRDVSDVGVDVQADDALV